MGNNFLSPAEITDFTINAGVNKTNLPVYKMLLMGFMAGVFIALGSQASNSATHTIESMGIARMISGTFFPAGLMMVVLCGAELFTGNCLIILSCLEKKSKWANFVKNLFFVFIGNLIGSLFVAFLLSNTGQWNLTGGMLGAQTIRIAAAKVNMPFLQAFCSGILCNIVVCLAVWMASAAKDVAGKILACFFPIWLFVLSGFEHCVANMYYIPAGIIAMANGSYVQQAMDVYGVSEASLANVTVSGFLMNNLLPVTLGNIVGGVVFVGCMYYLIFKTSPAAKTASSGVNAKG